MSRNDFSYIKAAQQKKVCYHNNNYFILNCSVSIAAVKRCSGTFFFIEFDNEEIN